MRLGVFALVCIHMLLWSGGLSAPGLRKLRSNEIFSRRAIDSIQINRSFWRKLLEDNGTPKSNEVRETTVNASVIVEPKRANEKNSTEADVHYVQKDSVSVDEKEKEGESGRPLKVGEGKTDAGAEGNEANKTGEPIATREVANPASKEGRPNTDDLEHNNTHTAIKEEEEIPISTANVSAAKEEVGSDIIVQETSGQSPIEAVNILADYDRHSKAASINHVFGEKAAIVEINNAPNVDARGSNVDKHASNTLPESVKEDSLPVENENHESAVEEAHEIPGKTEMSKESEWLENPAKESSKSNFTINPNEELAEANPIKMVASSSDVKEMDSGDADKVVLSTQAEGVDKLQISHENTKASVEKADNPNNSLDGSDGKTQNSGNSKVEDDTIEDKYESSGNVEIREGKGEGGAETVLQVQSDENAGAKQEVSDVNGDEHNESNGTEIDGEKTDQNQDLSGGSKDDESEERDIKDTAILAKSDDEIEAARKEVELQLEAIKRDTVMEMTIDQVHERDPSEDEYDIIQELSDLPTKFQETAGKVADHLRPDVIKWTDTSRSYLTLANQQITKSFSRLIGKQYAPFFASMVSYGILLLPLIVVILLFDHIKALFSLQKVLLFINIYLAAYFATLWSSSFILGLEPMSFFYLNSLSSYLSLQLVQGLGYFVYLILNTANIFHSCTSDTVVGKITSTLQWAVAMAIGLHYYVTVFHPAVASKPPHTSWKFYAVYTAAFFVLCLFARIRWVKKQYVTSGSNIADKKC